MAHECSANNNKLTNSPSISPTPPPCNSGYDDIVCPEILSIDIPASSDQFALLSPSATSVPQSVTTNTDDEIPANADVSSMEHDHNDNDNDDNDNSISHSRSNSYSASKTYHLYREQQKFKKQNGNKTLSTLKRPNNLPPKLTINDDNDDDEKDDEVFDRILLSYSRQESTSRDKRRSISSKKSISSNLMYRKKASSQRITHKLPKIMDVEHGPHPPASSTLTKKGTRGRRADTAQLIIPSPSMSNSTFNTLRKCNEINASIPLPTHTEKWNDSENDDNDNNNNNNIMIIKPNILHLQSKSTAYIDEERDDDIDNDDGFASTIALIGGSMTPTLNTRRSTIRPYNRPSITRGFSTSDINDMTGMGMDVVDIKHDQSYIDSDDSDDDDDDEEESIFVHHNNNNNDDDKKIMDPIQSELVFQTTAQSLMVSCGNSKEVFAALRKICIDLKKKESLPYIVPFHDKILKYDHVEAFLKLLGFSKNKQNNSWICHKNKCVATRWIDCAVLECHKCLLLIQKHSSIKTLVNTHRAGKNPICKKDAFKSQSPPFTVQTLSVVQQSKSYDDEESMILTSDDDDDDDEDEADADSVQLYELMWSITHNNNEDHAAKDVLLLCYPLVTTARHILHCCSSRFFNDDHDGRITVSNTSNSSPSSTLASHPSFPSFDGSGASNGASPKTHIRSTSSMEFNRNPKFERILSSFSVQAKVIEFLRHWMQRYWDRDWDSNPKLISFCKLFSRRIRRAYQCDTDNWEQNEIQKGLRLIEMLDKTMLNQKRRQKIILSKLLGDDNDNNNGHAMLTRKGRKNNKNNNNKHKKAKSKWSLANIGGSSHTKLPSELVDVNFVVIAEQITILQFNQFKKIHPRECLKQSWKNKDKKHIIAPNITQYILSFNRLTKWIQSTILVAENVKIRGKTIKKWVKVEEELYKLRNFQGLCAVYSALASTPIYTLKDSWSFVPKKHVIQHEMIKVIMKSTQNWKNLRRLQLETHPPMLPYFGMFAQDLIVIEETTNNRSNDGSINWDSLWRLKAAIDKHLIYQNNSYSNLSSDATIQRWMNKELTMSGKLDVEWVYQVSRNVSEKDKKELGINQSPRKKLRTYSLWNKTK